MVLTKCSCVPRHTDCHKLPLNASLPDSAIDYSEQNLIVTIPVAILITFSVQHMSKYVIQFPHYLCDSVLSPCPGFWFLWCLGSAFSNLTRVPHG
eukprot:763007-Hanusia_phi.AAC.5